MIRAALAIVIALALLAPAAAAHVPLSTPTNTVEIVRDGCPGTLRGPHGCYEYRSDAEARAVVGADDLARAGEFHGSLTGEWTAIHVPAEYPELAWHEIGHLFFDDLAPAQRRAWLRKFERGGGGFSWWNPFIAERAADAYMRCAVHYRQPKRYRGACSFLMTIPHPDIGGTPH